MWVTLDNTGTAKEGFAGLPGLDGAGELQGVEEELGGGAVTGEADATIEIDVAGVAMGVLTVEV